MRPERFLPNAQAQTARLFMMNAAIHFAASTPILYRRVLLAEDTREPITAQYKITNGRVNIGISFTMAGGQLFPPAASSSPSC